ncbi:helix-turn-helix domain-containing protein [candidate division TA06 bacterium]|nr:helix-turn-helix domain-containing protein [candidate division TA06 bacterium]
MQKDKRIILSYIPHQLHQKKYDDAIKSCHNAIMQNPKDYSLYYLKGLLQLYKYACTKTYEDMKNNLVVRTAAQEMIRCYKMMPKHVKQDDIELGLQFLYEYQQYIKNHNNIIYDLLDTTWDLKKANRILSGIYSTLANIKIKSKNRDQNILEAEQAISLNINNHSAHQCLVEIYKEQNDTKEYIENMVKWSKANRGHYIQLLFPHLTLAKQYISNKQYLEAGCHLLQAVRRANNILLAKKNNDYILTYDPGKGIVIKTEIYHPLSLDIAIYKRNAHILLMLALWRKYDFVRAKKHSITSCEWALVQHVLAQKGKNLSGEKKADDIWNNKYWGYWIIHKGIDTNESLHNLLESDIRSFEDIYNKVRNIEKDVQKEFNNKSYSKCNNIIDCPEFIGSHSLAYASRLYLLTLYATLRRIMIDDWMLIDYVKQNYVTMFINLHNDTLKILGIINESREIMDILDRYDDNSHEKYETLLVSLCALIKKIYQQYDFRSGIFAAMRLESFVTSVYQCKNREEIKAKQYVLLKVLMPDNNDELTLQDSEQKLVYKVLTNEGPMIENDIPQLKKHIKQYALWMDDRDTFCHVGGNLVKFAHREKAVLKELFINYKREIKRKELYKLSEKENIDDENVNRWISNIRKKAKWKKDDCIISEYGKGIQIKPGIKFCIIYVKD